jgi:hypothetical protein
MKPLTEETLYIGHLVEDGRVQDFHAIMLEYIEIL